MRYLSAYGRCRQEGVRDTLGASSRDESRELAAQSTEADYVVRSIRSHQTRPCERSVTFIYSIPNPASRFRYPERTSVFTDVPTQRLASILNPAGTFIAIPAEASLNVATTGTQHPALTARSVHLGGDKVLTAGKPTARSTLEITLTKLSLRRAVVRSSGAHQHPQLQHLKRSSGIPDRHGTPLQRARICRRYRISRQAC